MTYAEMLARVRSSLDSDASDTARYPESMIREYLIDGARLYCARVGSVRQSFTVTQTPGTALYALDVGCIAVNRVLWNNGGVYHPLSPTTIRELDERMASANGWEDDTGTRAEWYYIFGLNQIGLYPKITSGTQSYIVHSRYDVGGFYPYLLDSLQYVPNEDRDALVAYAVARALAADQRVDVAAEEFALFRETVEAAKRRRSSPDREVRMSSEAGWQSLERVLP